MKSSPRAGPENNTSKIYRGRVLMGILSCERCRLQPDTAIDVAPREAAHADAARLRYTPPLYTSPTHRALHLHVSTMVAAFELTTAVMGQRCCNAVPPPVMRSPCGSIACLAARILGLLACLTDLLLARFGTPFWLAFETLDSRLAVATPLIFEPVAVLHRRRRRPRGKRQRGKRRQQGRGRRRRR